MRRLETEVATAPSSPVAIVRRARQRKDGRGRTSDAYQIILTEAGLTGTHVPDGDEDQPEHPVRVEAPSGRPGPVGEEDQADVPVRLDEPSESRPTGQNGHDQPDKIARPTGHQCPTIQSVDPVCDPVSICARSESDAQQVPLALEAQESKPAPKPGAKRAPKGEGQPDPKVRELWDHYHAEHTRIRGAEPKFTTRQRGGVGRAWKDVLETVELDVAKLVITRALTAGYHVQPLAIVKELNRYLSDKQPGGGRGRNANPQTNTGAVRAEEYENANYE